VGSAQEPDRYEIRVKGHLADRWAAWFEGMTLTRGADGTTVIDGPVIDQSALSRPAAQGQRPRPSARVPHPHPRRPDLARGRAGRARSMTTSETT
jgi:hypothetical protein